MEKEDKIVVAIILGSVIFGGLVYSAILQRPVLLQNNSMALETASGISSSTQAQEKLSSAKTQECQADENTIVTKVIDGDTVVVGGGYHIRLLGIDADEKSYPCYEPAKVRLEELVLNKQVKLEKDTTDIDQYRRCLRAIFVGNKNISLELVREGLAVARFYEPDVKYKNEIQIAEKQVIENKKGCKWSDLR